MSAEDWIPGDAWCGEDYDDRFDEDQGYWAPTREPKYPTCNRCGKKELHWREVLPGKFALYETTERKHVCKPNINKLLEDIEL